MKEWNTIWNELFLHGSNEGINYGTEILKKCWYSNSLGLELGALLALEFVIYV